MRCICCGSEAQEAVCATCGESILEKSPISHIPSLPVAEGVTERVKGTGSLAVVLSSPKNMRTESRPQSKWSESRGKEKLDEYDSFLKELGISGDIGSRRYILLSGGERETIAEILCLDSSSMKNHPILLKVGHLQYLVAMALKDLGEWAESRREEHLRKAIEAYLLLETEPAAKRNLGLVHLELSENDEALEYIDTALKELRKDSGLWAAKGVLLHRAGEHQDSLKCFDRALKLVDLNPYVWMERGRLLIDMSRLEEALDSFDEAIVHDKMYLPAWREKLDTLLRLGKREEAELVSDIIRTMLTSEEDIEPQPEALEPIEFDEAESEPEETQEEEDIMNILLKVDGIGESRAETLVAHGIDSVKGLEAASVEDLASVKGISEKIAQNIKELTRTEEMEEASQTDWDAQNAIESAGLYLEEGQYEKALAEYDLLLKTNPDNEIAWINKAEILRALDRGKEAVEAFDKVISLNGENWSAWIEKANILFELGKPLDAVRCYEEIISADPNNVGFLMSRARILMEEENVDEAILCYNIVLEKDPEDVEANLGVISALLELGDLERAGEAIEAVEKMTPSDERIWWAKGQLANKTGRWGAAIQFYDKAISLKWDYVDAWMGKGAIFVCQGLHNEAMKCFEKVLELDDGNVDAWIGKAQAYHKRGENASALEWMDDFLDAHPTNEKALKFRNQLQAGSSGDERALLREADRQMERGDPDQAASITIRAIRRNPEVDDPWTLLGDLLLDIADPIRILNKLERETSEITKTPVALTNKGALLLRLGMYASAIKCFDQALAMDQNYEKAERLRERCLERTKGIR